LEYRQYLLLAKRLDAIVDDIWCQLVQTPTPRIKTDLHLGTFTCDGWDDQGQLRRSQVGLQDIPHILLGRLLGVERLEVLIFFPGTRRAEQKTATLRARDYAHWLDHIFLPAVRHVLPPSYSQAFSSSAQHANDLATARAQQTTVHDNPSGQPSTSGSTQQWRTLLLIQTSFVCFSK